MSVVLHSPMRPRSKEDAMRYMIDLEMKADRLCEKLLHPGGGTITRQVGDGPEVEKAEGRPSLMENRSRKCTAYTSPAR